MISIFVDSVLSKAMPSVTGLEYLIFMGLFVSIIKLIIIYFFLPFKFELKFINNMPVAIIYKRFFLLPLLVKSVSYKNLQKAFVKKSIIKTRDDEFSIYKLVLQFPKKTVILFDVLEELFIIKNKKAILIEYCEKINKSIASFENCEINKNNTVTLEKLVPFCFLLLYVYFGIYNEVGIIKFSYTLIFSLGWVAVFFILSLIIKIFTDTRSKEKPLYSGIFNDKETMDISSKYKKINS